VRRLAARAARALAPSLLGAGARRRAATTSRPRPGRHQPRRDQRLPRGRTTAAAPAPAGGGRCQASELDYDSILVEITEPARPTRGRLRREPQLPARSPGRGRRRAARRGRPPFFLPRGHLHAAALRRRAGAGRARGSRAECPRGSSPRASGRRAATTSGWSPLELILTPTARALGIATDRYSALSTCATDLDCGAAVVTDESPPGDYDAYRAPGSGPHPPPPSGVCEVVPDLATVAVLEDAEDRAQFRAPRADRPARRGPLEHVHRVRGGAHRVEPRRVVGLSARRISNRVVLGDPRPRGGLRNLRREPPVLAHAHPERRGDRAGAPGPARGSPVAPTIVVERSSLGLFAGRRPRSDHDVPAAVGGRGAAPGPDRHRGAERLLARRRHRDVDRDRPRRPARGDARRVSSARVSASERDADRGVFRPPPCLPGTYRVRVSAERQLPRGGSLSGRLRALRVPSRCDRAATPSWWPRPRRARRARPSSSPGVTARRGRVLTPAGARGGGAAPGDRGAQTTDGARDRARFGGLRAPRSTGTRPQRRLVRAPGGRRGIRRRGAPEARTGFAWLVRPGVPVEVAEPNLESRRADPAPSRAAARAWFAFGPTRQKDGMEHAILPGAGAPRLPRGGCGYGRPGGRGDRQRRWSTTSSAPPTPRERPMSVAATVDWPLSDRANGASTE
jgi:hypothetical protein